MEEKQEIKSEDVGSMEDLLGKDDSLFQAEEAKVVGETPQTFTAEPVVVDLTTTQEEVEHDAGYDEAIEAQTGKEGEAETPEDFGKIEAAKEAALNVDRPKKDIPVEVEIEYLKNMDTGNIFPVNETIIKQRHLKPCDVNGKLIYDSRLFFNGMR